MIEPRVEAPVTTGIRRALEELAPFADAPLWSLTPAEGTVNLELLARLKATVGELELRHAHQAQVDDRDAKTGWVRHTQQTPATAHARLRLAATPWSHGGETTIANAMTLCPRHHTRAHDPTYEMTTGKHGKVTFRRTWTSVGLPS